MSDLPPHLQTQEAFDAAFLDITSAFSSEQAESNGTLELSSTIAAREKIVMDYLKTEDVGAIRTLKHMLRSLRHYQGVEHPTCADLMTAMKEMEQSYEDDIFLEKYGDMYTNIFSLALFVSELAQSNSDNRMMLDAELYDEIEASEELMPHEKDALAKAATKFFYQEKL